MFITLAGENIGLVISVDQRHGVSAPTMLLQHKQFQEEPIWLKERLDDCNICFLRPFEQQFNNLICLQKSSKLPNYLKF
jgi:hypothetical protein